MRDFFIANHGSVVILTPMTDNAREWVDERIPVDALGFGRGICIEPRYLDDIIDGITGDGLTIGD